MKENSEAMSACVQKSRCVWADITKALAIFFIVWGHAASGSEVYFYRNVLYSFHVTTFLIVAGFFIKDLKENEQNFKSFWKFSVKQFFALLVPYIFWGIFFSNFSIKNTLPIFYGSYQSIKTVNPVGALWFVPAFFLARIFVRIIQHLTAKFRFNKFFITIPAAILFFVSGVMLPELENGYPFSFNISLIFVSFILLGYSVKFIPEIISKSKLIVQISAFLAALILFSVGTFLRPYNLELVCFYKGEYGNLFWFLWNGISGAFSTIFLSILLSRFNGKVISAIQFIGRESLGIMFVHVPFIRQMTMPLLAMIGFKSPLWLVSFCAAILATALSMLIVWIFGYMAPVFVGKKSLK